MITRPAVHRPTSIWSDLGVVALLAAALYGVMRVAKHWQAPLQPHVEINLSLWALPGYTVLSLLRGIAAYGLSLVFALTYGYLAAHRPRAERVLLPLLDVLQSIPVLGFLPGAVVALVALFPNTNAGLELASILMIFTGQVWNLAFSFYQSLRGIPLELREAAQLYQFNWWQRFRRVELSASVISLAWNSMMAMAGGWFFLMICESFTLGTQDFRLPGLGAYMSMAIAHRRIPAICAGILAMVLMIVIVDTCVWRPVLVWAQRFRFEETATAEAQGSRILRWFTRSWLTQAAVTNVAHPISEWLTAQANAPRQPSVQPVRRYTASTVRLLSLLIAVIGAAGMGWALASLWHLIRHLTLSEWGHLVMSAILTCGRVFAAVIVGSLWTIPVGIWIGRSDRLRSRLQPFVQIAASFPAPMLYPLLLLGLQGAGWGLGLGAVILMLIGTQWYILFNVIAGASSVPVDLREVAQAYRFTRRQRWQMVWWPAVFPYLITGWVTAAGGAWNASIVAEYISLGPQISFTPGLGSLISRAASQGHYQLLAAAVMTMAILVVLINRYLWKPLYRLAETRYVY
ncbi:MAG: ABC transporter permease subunit [Candidatus Omnitrophica bacterium]|nr:ABC transporter permease subunit [Candidatus Omnitrophota bacterium]